MVELCLNSEPLTCGRIWQEAAIVHVHVHVVTIVVGAIVDAPPLVAATTALLELVLVLALLWVLVLLLLARLLHTSACVCGSAVHGTRLVDGR